MTDLSRPTPEPLSLADRVLAKARKRTVYGPERDEVLGLRKQLRAAVDAAQAALWGKGHSDRRISALMTKHTLFHAGRWLAWRQRPVPSERPTKDLLAELSILLNTEAESIQRRLAEIHAARAGVEDMRRAVYSDPRLCDNVHFPSELPHGVGRPLRPKSK